MATRPGDMQSKYRIFISFTLSDQGLAEYLANELRRIIDDYNAVYCFTLPGTQDSQAGSRPADNLDKNIDDKLNKCNVFILLWSESARRQHWIKYELTHAKRLLIQEAKRMGKEFKIIPISINKCSIPFGLRHLVRASYTSGTDPQGTLNEVLNALGLRAEYDDPQVVFLKRASFEVKTAFERKEWSIVVRKYANLARDHPTVISAEMHYRYAIALINLESTSRSLMAAEEGLKLDNKEKDVALLLQYIHYLKEKRQWREILHLADRAIAKFPGDARWLQLRWDVVNRTNSPSSFFLFPNPQMIQQPSQTVNIGVNGTNGAITAVANDGNASFVSLQQFPSLFQDSLAFPDSPHFPTNQQSEQQMFDTGGGQTSADYQSESTRELSEEELQQEGEDSSWRKANTFTKKHVSRRKIEKLLEPSMTFVAIVNVIYIAVLALFLSTSTQFVICETIGILLVLYVGRFLEAEVIKLICIVLLMLFWAVSGYASGYRLYAYFSGGTGNSFGICIGVVSSLLILSIGGHFHLRLFHHE
jgi:tetratricopeptide (TPR) repeat protein